MDRRIINDPRGAPAFGYAQAVQVAGAQRLVFLSGQVPVRPDGTVPAGIDAQTRQVWANVAGHLAAAGMTLDNIVKVTVILSDRTLRSEFNAIADEIMAGRLVAWTTIVAATVRDDWLLEIEATAAG